MKRDTYLYDMKIKELLKVYREVAPNCITQKQALERVVRHQASRFFIQPHAAYCKLNGIFRKGEERINVTKAAEVRMYDEIYKRVLELSESPEHFGKSLYELCEIVVNQPAPEFYIEPSSLRGILHVQRKLIRERLRKLNKC